MVQRFAAPAIAKEFKLKVVLKNRTSDIDNVDGKALLDALQHYGIIVNDSLCVERHSKYGNAPEGCRVTLTYG